MSRLWTPPSTEAQLEAFRREGARRQARLLSQLYRDTTPPGHPLPIGGGGPALQTTLAILHAPVTKNNFTSAATIIGDDDRGPFSVDWFNLAGAAWIMEAMGVVSTTVTPTIAFRAAFGTVLATITTSLCTTATITTASGLANVNWYLWIGGRTANAAGSTSTTRASGYLMAQLATAAANNIINYLTNATPPSDVTTDFSSAVFLDLQVTWGTANASNTTTTNFYRLASVNN